MDNTFFDLGVVAAATSACIILSRSKRIYTSALHITLLFFLSVFSVSMIPEHVSAATQAKILYIISVASFISGLRGQVVGEKQACISYTLLLPMALSSFAYMIEVTFTGGELSITKARLIDWLDIIGIAPL